MAYYRAVLAWMLYRGGEPGDYCLAGQALLERPTYRMPEKYKKDIWVGFRVLVWTLLVFWKRNLPRWGKAPVGVAVCSDLERDKDIRYSHLYVNGQGRNFLFLSRQVMQGGSGFFSRVGISFMISICAIPVMVACIFSSRRDLLSLATKEWVEMMNMLRALRISGTRKVHLYSTYQRDSVLTSLLMMKRGIEVNLIPSEVPLAFVNRIQIGDALSLCMKYQQEEVESLGTNIRVKHIDLWTPENVMFYLHHYDLPADFSTPVKTVGFYSSGYKARLDRGDADVGDGYFEAEPALIAALAKWRTLPKAAGCRIIIFLHPVEKSDPETYQQSRKFYEELFGTDVITIAPAEWRTDNHFNQVDVAVSVISSVAFERLFMGFKTLFFPFKLNFPEKNHTIASICPKDEAGLFRLIDESLLLGRAEFFQRHGLEGYTVESFMDAYERAKRDAMVIR